MGIFLDNSLILNKIKSYYKFKNDAEFARFLEIKPNTLSNWYSRNSIDYQKIITKCVDIDANWLLTGKGEMLKTATPAGPPPKDRQKEIDRLLELLDQKDQEIERLKKRQTNFDLQRVAENDPELTKKNK